MILKSLYERRLGVALQSFNVLQIAACVAWNRNLDMAAPVVVYGLLLGQVASSICILGVMIDPWVVRKLGWHAGNGGR